jgi:L-asparaginase II
VHNNCSGKHAGMIALACHHGWPVAGYERVQHPVQQRIQREVARWTGVDPDEATIAIDGCGVVTFALPIESMARAFGRMAADARHPGTPAERVISAMATHPEYVAGTDRLCTVLARATDGRIIAKTGAEGVYCAAVPGAELGIALKVEDGAKRASEPALLAVLNALTLITDDAMTQLTTFAEPFIMNTCGHHVGVVRANIRLAAHS